MTDSITLENISCRLCSSSLTEKIFHVSGFNIYHCLNCDVEFIPQMSQNLHDLQTEAFDDTTFSNSHNEQVLKYWQGEMKSVTKYASRGGKILDIGCNDGLFLSLFDSSWEKHGIELAPTVAKVAESKGITVHQKPLEHCEFKPEQFEVITMYMIIEHLENPMKAIAQISKWLKPNGLFVLLTGATNSLKTKLLGKNWAMYTPPIHQFFFSEQSLQFLLKKNQLHVSDYKYTYGGMTEFNFRPLRLAEHVLGKVMTAFPVNQLPIYDHLYLYAVKK